MILVIDNFDSFTYNLVQYLGRNGAQVKVFRNDQLDLNDVVQLRASGILLSPGPCTPEESGVCLDILKAARGSESPFLAIPIFGVCLGMEAMGFEAGGEIRRARTMMHGKSSLVKHDSKGVFEGLHSPLKSIRYHSLVIEESSLPSEYLITARSTDDQEIMGLRHQSKMIEGVQFHPESILSEGGMEMIGNFLKMIPQ